MLNASFSGSDHLGCFNADAVRSLLMLEIGMSIPNRDEPLNRVYETHGAPCIRRRVPILHRRAFLPYFHIRPPHSDHATCRGGTMSDICMLREDLVLRGGSYHCMKRASDGCVVTRRTFGLEMYYCGLCRASGPENAAQRIEKINYTILHPI